MSAALRLLFLLLGVLLAAAGVAKADDVAGSADHPMVGRFAGADIVSYKAANDDEAALLQAPHDYASLLERNALSDRSGAEWLQLEGKVTQLRYEVPDGHSSLEVMKAYAAKLAAEGFKTLFQCEDQACFVGKVNDDYLLGLQLDTENNISTRYFSHARYLLAELERPGGGAVYVAILTGEDQAKTSAFVEVVETGAGGGAENPADSIKIVNANEMAADMAEGQTVNLYGLLFDTDSTVLKPGSEATLAEIAKLMAGQPKLRLQVVGHTDNQGAADYNLDLSQRRAAAVVAALTGAYGITPERLTAFGRGLTQPIASNDTEDGRAKNRRVELVPQ